MGDREQLPESRSLFFFSSRRRHTRLQGDWSSDVCSSDLQLSSDLTVNVLFERRVGVGRASIADPVRALPFLQTEGDYWSAGAGLELLPKGEIGRASCRERV